MTLNCLIVDDEPLALDLLESYVSRTPFLHLVAQCDSAVKALSVIEEEPIDLVFLDIQMPELNGLELSRLVGNKVKIIFTTAFEQYALEGFRVDALDYLLKPFNYTEFLLVTSCRLCTSHITAHKNLISAFFQHITGFYFREKRLQIDPNPVERHSLHRGSKRLHSHPNRGQGGRYSHADEHEEYRGPSPRRHIHPGTPFLYRQYQQN